MPRSSVRIAGELRTALHNAGITGPYILVASAYGGDNVRTFADLDMDEVAGLVLDDADPDDLEPEAMREEAHRGHAGIPSDLRDCRNAIAEHKPLPALGSVSGRPQQTCAQQFFPRGLPEAEWSPELNAKVLEIAQTKVAMYDADASDGTNAVGRSLSATTPPLIRLPAHPRAHLRKPRCRPLRGEAPTPNARTG
jgi:hypothetical protein